MADLELRATVLPGEPLSLHVSLVNPVGPAGPRLVPRLLTPVGLWIAVTVLDRDGSTVWESTRPKAALKLHPMRRDRRRQGVVLERGVHRSAGEPSRDTGVRNHRAAARRLIGGARSVPTRTARRGG